MNGIEIVSTGYAKIEKTLDNQQLEQMVETSNEWIVSRTGILKRHLSDKSSAFLAIEAAKKSKSRFKSTCFNYCSYDDTRK